MPQPWWLALSTIGKRAQAPEIARRRGPVLLTEAELDRVAGAGSKPGGAGDGDSIFQRPKAR
jgi:hypothetical protein